MTQLCAGLRPRSLTWVKLLRPIDRIGAAQICSPDPDVVISQSKIHALPAGMRLPGVRSIVAQCALCPKPHRATASISRFPFLLRVAIKAAVALALSGDVLFAPVRLTWRPA
jgi:hypothetical protein